MHVVVRSEPSTLDQADVRSIVHHAASNSVANATGGVSDYGDLVPLVTVGTPPWQDMLHQDLLAFSIETKSDSPIAPHTKAPLWGDLALPGG